jgi:SAM-dependent methyltransferase
LNLGCGSFPKAGFVNVDAMPGPGVDVAHDLNRIPYPFADGKFAIIEADHVLEHLSDVLGVMRELHRLLEPGGRLVVRVPHFSRGFTHPEHQRGFDVTFHKYFEPTFLGGYAGVAFELEQLRMRWFAQPYLKRSVLPPPIFAAADWAGRVLDRAANLSPTMCSRLWCYWVGGFEEIEFRLRKA